MPRCAAAAALLLTAAAGPYGDWSTEDRQGVIRIAPCAAAVCGTIVGASHFDRQGQTDRTWRGEPQCGFALLLLRPGNDGRLHGTVTNPEDGRTYNAEVWVPPDGVLRLRGYVGIELFGSTQHWPPFHGTVGQGCHFTTG